MNRKTSLTAALFIAAIAGQARADEASRTESRRVTEEPAADMQSSPAPDAPTPPPLGRRRDGATEIESTPVVQQMHSPGMVVGGVVLLLVGVAGTVGGGFMLANPDHCSSGGFNLCFATADQVLGGTALALGIGGVIGGSVLIGVGATKEQAWSTAPSSVSVNVMVTTRGLAIAGTF